MGLLEPGGLADVGANGTEDGVGKEARVEVWRFFPSYVNPKISHSEKEWRKKVDRRTSLIFLRLSKFPLLLPGCVFLIP